MPKKIVVINAFGPEDFFIARLSEAYYESVTAQGAVTSILSPKQMDFAMENAPENTTYATLEPDLQKSVDLIRDASVVSIFSTFKPVMESVFTGFIARLFSDLDGMPDSGIWGSTTFTNTKLRIITVIDDHDTWHRYKFRREASALPIQKTDFTRLGFENATTATFGYLTDNIINEYALNKIAKMHQFGTADVTRD